MAKANHPKHNDVRVATLYFAEKGEELAGTYPDWETIRLELQERGAKLLSEHSVKKLAELNGVAFKAKASPKDARKIAELTDTVNTLAENLAALETKLAELTTTVKALEADALPANFQ